MTPQGVFVTGTGTGVGKTIASACLTQRWQATYWKPVQTGTDTDYPDSATIALLSGAARIAPPRYVFRAPLSPEAASALENTSIALEDFDLPVSDGPVVVEGAGGVLVPLNAQHLMIDLMVRLALPVIVVAGTGLGTINHTLLSLEALRARHLIVAGVVLVGPANPGNRDAIRNHGQVRVLHSLPMLDPLDADTVQQASAAFPDFATVLA